MNSDLILTKVAVASNKEFIKNLIDKLDIKKTDKIAVAFWVSPIVYRMICEKSDNVYYIEDVSSKGIFGNIKNAKYIDLSKGEYWVNMDFDKVIMNPPYNGNLHVRILKEVCKHTKNIISLEPNDFLVDCLYKDKLNIDEILEGHINSVIMIDKNYMMKAFPQTTFSKDACIIDINMNEDNLNSVDDYRNKIQEKIIKKFTDLDNLKNHYDINKNKYFVKIPFIHGHQGSKDMYEVVSPKCRVNDESTNGYHIYFKTKTEAENLLKSFKLRSYRYVYKCFKKAINNDPEHLVWLGDYTKEWTDKDIYKIFNITKEEQKIIEETMIQYE